MRLYWCAETGDALGTQTSGLVLPLFLLALGQSPAVVGLVTGVSAGAGLLLAPFAAVLADRGARRRVMVWSALLSATAIGSVAAAAALDRVSLVHVLTAVGVERLATSCQQAAAGGTVAALVEPADYPRVVARLQAGEQGALVLGPFLGGALYQCARWLPFLADALSYLLAAVCVRGIRSELDPVGRRPGSGAPPPAASGCARRPTTPWRAFAGELGAGLAVIRSQPFLRLVLLWTTTVGGVLVALYYGAVFTLRDHGTDPAALGVALSLAGCAGLAGALAAPRLARRVSGARLLVAVGWLLVPLAAGVALATRVWLYGVLFGALSLLTGVVTVVLQARAVELTPHRLQARTGTVLATGAGVAAALAPVLAGLCAARLGAAALGTGCAVLLALVAGRTTAVAARGGIPGGAA
ncbi:MFS transporter [Streptomyces albus subsp. albus]|nr:MFS transporter [Streptomyces albus subsp. albus]